MPDTVNVKERRLHLHRRLGYTGRGYLRARDRRQTSPLELADLRREVGRRPIDPLDQRVATDVVDEAAGLPDVLDRILMPDADEEYDRRILRGDGRVGVRREVDTPSFETVEIQEIGRGAITAFSRWYVAGCPRWSGV